MAYLLLEQTKKALVTASIQSPFNTLIELNIISQVISLFILDKHRNWRDMIYRGASQYIYGNGRDCATVKVYIACRDIFFELIEHVRVKQHIHSDLAWISNIYSINAPWIVFWFHKDTIYYLYYYIILADVRRPLLLPNLHNGLADRFCKMIYFDLNRRSKKKSSCSLLRNSASYINSKYIKQEDNLIFMLQSSLKWSPCKRNKRYCCNSYTSNNHVH